MGDWKREVLQHLLAERAQQTRPKTIAAFVSTSTHYYKLVRSVPWERLGFPGYVAAARVLPDM